MMKVIVIGNGVAGNTASFTIRRLDSHAEIAIVSEERHPEYSACALPHYLAGDLERERLFLKTSKDYNREGIKTIFGQKVVAISPENKRVFLDSRSLAYDKLVVATGSRPLIPPIGGIKLEGVFPLKSLDDADRILRYNGRRAVVVGSGPIGVEASIALHKRGVRVHLIELVDRIMPRVFDEMPSSLLRDLLEKNGIEVSVGERVEEVIGNGRVEGIVTDKRQMECDMVIFGAGMKPNVELAEQSGLKIGGLGGLSVDRQMMTNFSDIYACGDCVEAADMITGEPALSLLWHNARWQGEIAGYNCAGVARGYPGSQSITSLDIFGTHAVSFGYTQSECSQDRGIEVTERVNRKNYRRLITRNGRLVGAQFIGDTRDMGALLCLLLRRNNLEEIGQMLDKVLIPWHFKVARFIAPLINRHT